MKAKKKSKVNLTMTTDEAKNLSSALDKANTSNIGFNNRGLSDKEVKALTALHEAIKKAQE